MSGFRIGGLFEGYGGLTMGVQLALGGGELAWYSEYEPATEKNPRPSQAPARLLAHRHPGVPNLGDITSVKWTPDCPACGQPLAIYQVGSDGRRAYWCRTHGEFDLSIRTADVAEPVDVLCGGSPCQDVSAAGRRAGMRPGTRSGLWESMREAIATLRPRLVVWENVRGVTSACAHSELADCPRCVGGSGPHVPVLRALGRVLGDLADLGFDAEWHGLPASDIGAPHERWREFVCAWPAGSPIADAERGGWAGWASLTVGRQVGRAAVAGGRLGIASDADHLGYEGSWATWDGGAGFADDARATVADSDCDELARQRTQRPGRAAASRSGCGDGCQRDRDWRVWRVDRWVDYGPAIRRWHDLTRCVPSPVEQGSRGGWRLAPAFSEWMQGLPAGHVTDPAIGISRNDQLKLIGNGVIPQQSAEAVRVCLWRAVALDGAA